MPGKSDPYRNISSQKDEYGLWIREVLDHYNADEISFAVSSYSSAMFLSFAKRYPKRVKSALLLVPSGIAHGPILPMMGKMVVPFLKYYLRPSEKTLDAVIETMGGKGDPVWREFFDLMMSSYKMEMKPPREYTKYELASFKAPLLIIASENDIFFPAKKVFRKAKEIFTGPVSTYKIDSKHLPSDETMIYVCKRTEEFLNTIEITDGYFYDEPTNILHNDEFYEKQYVVLTDKNDNGRMWKGYIYYHLNIGSDKRCDITIPTDYDDSVKPLHCRIVKKTDSSFYVAVLAISAMNNDTRLNGRPVGVDDPCQIHEGDELSVGSHTYIVDFE
ncbi:MAG: FHA domain-containing protein [Lachnospiraceae bacterium]|nr:FHA domain-containing protein [Lachnospiraceae bacterium]